jgi:type II secretory pathway pseudopilin PulG
MVAISDAVNRDPHPFTLEWDDEAQHKAILEKIQSMARAQLAAYGSTPTTPPPTSAPAAKNTTPTTARSHRPATAPAPQTPLLDEDLKAYTLSYGGAPTYVYSANTGGTGAALRYVTIVAQDDGLGEIKPAIQSVTDAAHFNRTPKMQFVDVVDADASNRASLLFELRSQTVRQFALYRVIASHPEQIFLTGTTQ